MELIFLGVELEVLQSPARISLWIALPPTGLLAWLQGQFGMRTTWSWSWSCLRKEKRGAGFFGYVNFSFTVIAATPYTAHPSKAKLTSKHLTGPPREPLAFYRKVPLFADIRGAFVNAEPSCPRFLLKAPDNMGVVLEPCNLTERLRL